MLLMLILAPATQAQRPVLVTESAFAKRVGDSWQDGPQQILSVTVGFMTSVSKRIGLGGVVQGGVAGDMYSSVGPRVRIQASPDLAIDLTPLVRLSAANPETGRIWLDAGLMYRDLVGVGMTLHLVDQHVSLHEPPWSETRQAQPVVTAGLRLGSRPGRIGAGVMGLAMVAAGVAFAAGGW
jgi:hypothetical protein